MEVEGSMSAKTEQIGMEAAPFTIIILGFIQTWMLKPFLLPSQEQWSPLLVTNLTGRRRRQTLAIAAKQIPLSKSP